MQFVGLVTTNFRMETLQEIKNINSLTLIEFAINFHVSTKATFSHYFATS